MTKLSKSGKSDLIEGYLHHLGILPRDDLTPLTLLHLGVSGDLCKADINYIWRCLIAKVPIWASLPT